MVQQFAIGGIGFYQRWLSPYKGFRCAHHVVHGRGSCSDYIKEMIAEHGVIAAWPLMRTRFVECRIAAASAEENVGPGPEEMGQVTDTGSDDKPKKSASSSSDTCTLLAGGAEACACLGESAACCG